MTKHWAVPPAEQWEAEAERLIDLLRYFRIPYNDPDPWFALAAALARKHYPQGAPNPIGRPGRGSIAKLYHLGRKRGRPRKYPPRQGPARPRGRPQGDQIACLHNSVWFYQEEHTNVTDIAAITAVLKECAHRHGLSERQVLADLPRLRQALSRYRARLKRQLQ